MTQQMRIAMAATALTSADGLNLFMKAPSTMAPTMKSIDMVAVIPFVLFSDPSGLNPLNVSATMEAKAAMTRMRVMYAKIRNSFLALSPMDSDMIVPMERPLFLTEAKSDPKSCTAPKNSPPTSIQIVTGIHPKMAAWMGPVMGPAPAIEEKWCPRSTWGWMRR